MVLSLQERSQYFKGLLILMRKDRKIDEVERKFLIKIGKLLGFEKKFCERAISDLLENVYLIDDIPKFSRKEFAESFILDGLSLAVSDMELNPDEINFLKATIKENNLSESWFSKNLEDLIKKKEINNSNITLSVEQYL
ncbi:MAG: hypothetical protein KKB34_06655 [Bacteroidetes bacterium]|nr:hypothetical protein [Bacteroidota bacterium]